MRCTSALPYQNAVEWLVASVAQGSYYQVLNSVDVEIMMSKALLILIKGAGDLATGVAVRLRRAGFAVAMTELARPLAVRRTVAFAQAAFDGEQTVEGIQAKRCSSLAA